MEVRVTKQERKYWAYIGVIGIDFRASQQSGFQDCVVDPNEDIIEYLNSR
ncbi:hypothetical protein O9992_18120 [Vibrio lentus]|nr:hypothetical protein [Vibrio lentus]